MEEKIKKLEELCKPVAEYLKNNWDPHCTVIITNTHIKLVRDEVGIPLETAQEVPVQEQLTKKDVYCISKHLQVFTKKYYHEQDISDSAICGNCEHIKECTNNYSKVCDPYPSLIKVANMAELKISEFKTNL